MYLLCPATSLLGPSFHLDFSLHKQHRFCQTILVVSAFIAIVIGNVAELVFLNFDLGVVVIVQGRMQRVKNMCQTVARLQFAAGWMRAYVGRTIDLCSKEDN